MSNALLLARRGTKVRVRVNVTAEIADVLSALAEALRERGVFGVENLSFYCSAVNRVRGLSEGRSFPPVLTTAALQEAMRDAGVEEMLGSPLKRTCDEVESLFGNAGTLKTDQTCHCMLGHRESMAIDPAGDVYGCYEEVGDPDRRMGTITEQSRLLTNERHTLYRRRMRSPRRRGARDHLRRALRLAEGARARSGRRGSRAQAWGFRPSSNACGLREGPSNLVNHPAARRHRKRRVRAGRPRVSRRSQPDPKQLGKVGEVGPSPSSSPMMGDTRARRSGLARR